MTSLKLGDLVRAHTYYASMNLGFGIVISESKTDSRIVNIFWINPKSKYKTKIGPCFRVSLIKLNK